jgi:hypothetical protein
MTDTPAATQYLTATVAEPAEPNSRSNRPRGGRGGRGGRQEVGQHFRPEQGQGQRGRSRGGYRGSRGSRSEQNASYDNRRATNSATEPETLKPPPLPDLGGGGTFGTRLTEDARKEVGEGTTKEKVEAADAEEAEVCFICASPVTHHSVAPCNHRTCHICALRLRALYKTRACAHCRVRCFYFCGQILN